jgi:hypothetical protein
VTTATGEEEGRRCYIHRSADNDDNKAIWIGAQMWKRAK